MIQIFKKLLGIKEKRKVIPDPPGRTFKRILTGDYFGCKKNETDDNKIAQAKQNKIDLIKEHKLLPMFIRYTSIDNTITSAHVAFQKELHNKKWNMIHITEVSFTVASDEFDEFVQMSGVDLSEDFRDLTAYEKEANFKGVKRRREKRKE